VTEYAFLIPALPYFTAMKNELIEATIKRALGHMKAREMTPELAYNLWLEVWGADAVISRLEKKVRFPNMTEEKSNG